MTLKPVCTTTGTGIMIQPLDVIFTPDPIGLAGGINPFVYTENNPINWIDPKGLVKWSGKYNQGTLSAFVGASFIKYEMSSECINNKRAIVTVYAVGPTGALGLEVSVTEGDINMHDFNDSIQPSAFNGGFATLGGGVALGKGWSSSNTTLGHVFADKPFNIGDVKGIDATLIGLTMGTSTVWDVKWEECCP
jgi:hypothetical protein